MLLGIEHVVRNAFLREHGGEKLGVFDRGRAEKYRLTAFVAGLHVVDDRAVLFVDRAVDLVLLVDADHLAMRRHDDRFKAVDVLEFVGFGVGRAGHAGELPVHAEEVLERDRRHRLVFLLDLHAFLGLDGLVKTFAPAAAWHQAARELVDDDDLAVLHDVVLVAVEERVRTQGGVEVVHQDDVLRRIERLALLHETALGENLLEMLVTGLGEVDLMGLLIDPIVALALFLSLAGKERRNVVDGTIEFRVVVGGAGDDERRAGLVNENRVHFVDDRIVERTLAASGDVVLHVVTQVVEAEFVVRAVRDVGGIGGALFLVVLIREDLADRKTEPVVEAAHPVRVAGGKVIVDGHDVAALAGKGVEVHGERGGECLAFARAHFSDLAVVENHCADELHVEVAHAEHAHGGFTNHGKSFGEELVGRRALGDAVAEFLRLGLQLFVRERLHGGLELVDGIALAAILLDQAVVATTEDFCQKFVKHCV